MDRFINFPISLFTGFVFLKFSKFRKLTSSPHTNTININTKITNPFLVVGVVIGPWDVVETVGVGVVVLVVGVFTDPDTLGVLVLVLDFVEYEVDFLLE